MQFKHANYKPTIYWMDFIFYFFISFSYICKYLQNSHNTIPTETDILSECFVPN